MRYFPYSSLFAVLSTAGFLISCGSAGAPDVAPDAEASLRDGVSPSSAFSRRLRGVFLQAVTVEPSRIRLGDSIDVQVQEAWMEREWACKQRDKFGEVDCSTGAALDTANDIARTQLVLAITPASKLGHLKVNALSQTWQLVNARDPSQRQAFIRTRGGQLILPFLRINPGFPMKFYVRVCPYPGPNCKAVTVDSLMIR